MATQQPSDESSSDSSAASYSAWNTTSDLISENPKPLHLQHCDYILPLFLDQLMGSLQGRVWLESSGTHKVCCALLECPLPFVTGFHDMDQAASYLFILLPQPPKCWDPRWRAPHPTWLLVNKVSPIRPFPPSPGTCNFREQTGFRMGWATGRKEDKTEG